MWLLITGNFLLWLTHKLLPIWHQQKVESSKRGREASRCGPSCCDRRFQHYEQWLKLGPSLKLICIFLLVVKENILPSPFNHKLKQKKHSINCACVVTLQQRVFDEKDFYIFTSQIKHIDQHHLTVGPCTWSRRRSRIVLNVSFFPSCRSS